MHHPSATVPRRLCVYTLLGILDFFFLNPSGTVWEHPNCTLLLSYPFHHNPRSKILSRSFFSLQFAIRRYGLGDPFPGSIFSKSSPFIIFFFFQYHFRQLADTELVYQRPKTVRSPFSCKPSSSSSLVHNLDLASGSLQ